MQILFLLSDAERGRLPQVLQAVGNASVLTVGETPGFAEAGCAIYFVRQGTKGRFQINQQAAARQRLTLERSELRLALIVRAGWPVTRMLDFRERQSAANLRAP